MSGSQCAVKPLSLWGPQDLPLRSGAGGVGRSGLQGRPLLHGLGRPSVSLCAWPRLCLRHPLASCWGFLVPSPHLPPPAERPELALCWRDADMVPFAAAAAPAVGVSGEGWGTGLTDGGGVKCGGGAGAPAEPLCPPLGALQEFPQGLSPSRTVAVQACMDVLVPCSFSLSLASEISLRIPVELFIYWFRGRRPPIR